MKVLILSWYFPPINEIGAVRVGKLAEYLHEHGHDVFVISARRKHPDRSLPMAIPPDRVIRTDWIDVDRLSSPWTWLPQRRRKPRGAAQAVSVPNDSGASSARDIMARHYMWLVRFPDRQGGWLPYLVRAADRLMRNQSFDLLYASGPPFTTFVAAARLSRRFQVPWVAEYRDGWSRDHYTPKPEWRERIDTIIEKRVTGTSAGIVAVSEPWAQAYAQRFGKPTAAVYNGFDPGQLASEPSFGRPGLPLTVVHMGNVYSGLRDPAVLFEAIKLAGLTPEEIEVAFYGAVPGAVLPLAAKFGVTAFVTVPPRVPYDQALEIQRTSDVLLLLQSPADIANVPAKTFEYFAARRPILGLGLDQGIPAKLVRSRHAGSYVTDPHAVAQKLKEWVRQKRESGVIPPLPESACAGLSREEQFARLERFLTPLAKAGAAERKAEKTMVRASPESFPQRPVSMLPRDDHAIVDFSGLKRPHLLVIADAEEEFDWEKPFSSSGGSVTTMNRSTSPTPFSRAMA